MMVKWWLNGMGIQKDDVIYHLVMTNIANWKIPKINGGLELGKSSINWPWLPWLCQITRGHIFYIL